MDGMIGPKWYQVSMRQREWQRRLLAGEVDHTGVTVLEGTTFDYQEILNMISVQMRTIANQIEYDQRSDETSRYL